jgi:hypothetical protein
VKLVDKRVCVDHFVPEIFYGIRVLFFKRVFKVDSLIFLAAQNIIFGL